MGRMNTLSVTFMVAVVLSICFFIYQSTQESDSKQGEGETGKVELAKNISTEAVLADWTQDSHVIEATKTLVSKKERPAVPVLISTSATPSSHKTITTDTPKHVENAESSPELHDVHFRFDRSGLSKETWTLLDHHVTVLQDSKWSVLLNTLKIGVDLQFSSVAFENDVITLTDKSDLRHFAAVAFRHDIRLNRIITHVRMPHEHNSALK